MSKLEDQLLLFDFVTDLLGGDYGALVKSIRGADSWTRADGQSFYLSVFESRGAQVKIDRRLLAEFDQRLLKYQAALGKQRPEFRFTYFQYLAALYSEIFLARLADDPAAFLKEIRVFHRAKGYDLPPYEASDLSKLAFWMATGAGKTLIAHVNLLQWKHYRPFNADNVILVTPSEQLSQQHMEELAISGISAARADKSGAWAEVQVIEITKLYIDGIDSEKRRGGVSMPVSTFEGRNLVLVDEGHKGSTSASDVKDERRWRSIREALAGERGFTIEYSATFAQITEDNEDLRREYSKAILVDYGYRRFWEDGYGKDYQIVNLKEEGAYDVDELLLAGLLTLYEQRRFFDDHPAEMSDYNIEAPLMAFVGATVTGKSDSEVLDVVLFLDRVLKDPAWAKEKIVALLRGESGLPSNLFSHRYPYLGDLTMSEDEAYRDLCARLFHGTGQLTMHHIRRAEGEIGLRTADAEQDLYCGVVNVGNASGFFKMASEAGVSDGEDDHITQSVFDAIDDAGSPVNLLIGSKKFIEGWSSWRVSVMGLLKVGKNSGPQVIQLFGRGVRLKGWAKELRRSDSLPGEHPPNLGLVETLHIFGVKADYMQAFNAAVRREGMPPPVARTVPITIASVVGERGLRYPHPGTYRFSDEVIVFDPGALDRKIQIDLMPQFTTARGIEELAAAEGSAPVKEALLPAEYVDVELAFLHALEYKRRRNWSNIYITRKAIGEFLSGGVRLRAPEPLFNGVAGSEGGTLMTAALDAVNKALERFTYSEQRKRENAHLTTGVLTDTHPNFPRPWISDGDDSPAYLLAVPESLVDAVDELTAGLADGSIAADDDLAEPLPRLYMDEHLYGPLLVAEAQEAGPGPRSFGVLEGVRSVPAGLVASEVLFIRDLRDAWQRLSGQTEWKGYELHLLRNLPKRGVGFFATAGFYPDFLLWLKRGEVQTLAFVEPHGMVIWDPVKVGLLRDIRELQLDIPLLAYIVTETEPRSVGAIGGEAHREQWFRERHILFQDGTGYVEEILGEARATLEGLESPAMHPSPTIVDDSAEIEDEKFESMLPVYSLKAAAGYFGAGESVELEGWVEVTGYTLSRDMFVARAVGHSMEPRIGDGDLCIFRKYRGGTRQERIMLFQWQGDGDLDTGGSYAVKKYAREQELVDGGELAGVRVTLSSLNPEYEPILIEAEYADDIAAIAEYVDSIGTEIVG